MTREEFMQFVEGEGKVFFEEVAKSKNLSVLDKQAISNFLDNTDDGKSLKFSIGDKRLESFKKNGEFKKEYDAEFKRNNPGVSDSDKRIQALEEENANFKKNSERMANIGKIKGMNEYGLPDNILELLVNEDFDGSVEKFKTIGTSYKDHFDKSLGEQVEKKLGATPPPAAGGTANLEGSTFDDILSGKKV